MEVRDEKATGWEYEVLDLLAENPRREVWNRAFRKWMQTPKAIFITIVCVAPLSLSLSIVWVVAGAFGWGIAGKFVAEIVVHLTFVLFLHPVFQRINRRNMRPFVADELLSFVRQRLVPGQRFETREDR